MAGAFDRRTARADYLALLERPEGFQATEVAPASAIPETARPVTATAISTIATTDAAAARPGEASNAVSPSHGEGDTALFRRQSDRGHTRHLRRYRCAPNDGTRPERARPPRRPYDVWVVREG
jgi:hypothetical protein